MAVPPNNNHIYAKVYAGLAVALLLSNYVQAGPEVQGAFALFEAAGFAYGAIQMQYPDLRQRIREIVDRFTEWRRGENLHENEGFLSRRWS